MDPTLKILLQCLLFGIVLAAMIWFYRTDRARRPSASRTSPSEVPAEFRRRWRRSLRYLLAWLGGMASMVLSGYLFITPREGWLGSTDLATTVGLAGLLAFGISNLMLWSEYRCPACERPLQDGDGLMLNPSSCPRCGASFR